MYGKNFASMYTGSMFGKSATVFAVMTYAITCMRPNRSDGQCFVEINPTLLAATFATTPAAIMEALADLESPDPASRSKGDDGRRLARLDEERHAGPMQYRVVNGAKYRAMRDEEDRRIYLREAKRKERAGKRVNNVNHGQPRSAQAEVEVEAKESLFNERWAKYPKKFGKGAARKSFAKQVTDDIQRARFDRALANYLQKIQMEKTPTQYILHGERFFGNKWEDYVDYQSTPVGVERKPPVISEAAALLGGDK